MMQFLGTGLFRCRNLRGWFYRLLVTVWLAAAIVLVITLSPAKAESDYSAQSSERLVTVYDRGREKSVVTSANDVRSALKAADVDIDEARDVVEPDLDNQLSGRNYRITVYRGRIVTVVDGASSRQVVTTEYAPEKIAQAAGVSLYKEDNVSFASTENLLINGPSLVMKIKRAPQRTVTEDVAVDFPIEQIKDAGKPVGYKEVKKAGKKGKKRVSYLSEMKDGREVSRKIIAQTELSPPQKQVEVIGMKPKNPLTKDKGAHIFIDSKGVAHRETYYDLPMNIVISACGGGGYTVRGDGAKVDKDGYILVAANYANYPRCSVVETSMGLGRVYDTGGFAVRHPHGFDLATDWTKADGR